MYVGRNIKNFVLILIFMVIGITLVGNIFLIRLNWTQGMPEMSVRRTIFIFPNRVIIKDISLGLVAKGDSTEPCIIPKAEIRFSLKEFFKNRKFLITDIILSSPKVNIASLSRFIQARVQTFLKTSQKEDNPHINIYVKDASIGVATQKSSYASGGLTFKGVFTSDGFSLEDVFWGRKKLHAKLWAEVKENILSLKGFVVSNSDAGKSQESGALSVLDIDGRIRVVHSRLDIEHFYFEVNNTPVNLSGYMVFSNPVAVEVTAAILQSPADSQDKHTAKLFGTKQADIRWSGYFQEKIFNSRIGVDIYSSNTDHKSRTPDRMAFVMDHIVVNPDPDKLWNAHWGSLSASLWNSGHSRTLRMDNGVAELVIQPDAPRQLQRVIRVHVPFYGGSLQGKIQAESLKVTGTFTVNDGSAYALNDDVFEVFPYVEGRLFGRMKFISSPRPCLKGQFTVDDAELKEYQFLSWIADSFNLPVLNDAHFTQAGAHFFIDADKAAVQDIHVESDDIRMTGYFSMIKNNLIASQISLRLKRNLLVQSHKSRRLLNLFEQETPHLDFTFKLSGPPHKINFQWLGSGVKTRVQDYIPDFMERKIEQQMAQ